MEVIGNNTGEGRERDKWVKSIGEGRKERDGAEDTEEVVCLWIAVGLIDSPCCNLQKLCVCQAIWLPHFASWITEKMSLLSRLFRRSGRKQRGLSAPPVALATFSAQFPPAEWFNQRVVHLHSIGTQTLSSAASQHSVSVSRFTVLPYSLFVLFLVFMLGIVSSVIYCTPALWLCLNSFINDVCTILLYHLMWVQEGLST